MQEMHETQVQSLGWGDPLEKEMVTHFSILACKISWTEEPGGLVSPGVTKLRHNCATDHALKLMSMLQREDTLQKQKHKENMGMWKHRVSWDERSIYLSVLRAEEKQRGS